MKGKGKTDPRGQAREALRTAAGRDQPDVSRLVAAVPAMMAEVRRRRDAPVDPFVAIVLMARQAIPRLAAAAAVLVLVATLASLRDGSITQADADDGLEQYILTGELGDEVSDVLLQAIAGQGSDNG